ncbi:MAG: AtpZ/AtpI family protein [Anaerolineaceae bacterium]|nr:AtpZ/AtpI family protein [Anaerolineaceae bacterium]
MGSKGPAKEGRKQYYQNMALAVVAGQVGCITLVIILLAVLAGLWLDNHFQTKPTITLILVIGSVPGSVIVMLAVVRGAVARINLQSTETKTEQSLQSEEETDID